MGVTTRSAAARRDSLVPDSTLQPTSYKDPFPTATGDTYLPPTSPTTNAHWHEFRRMVGPSIRTEFEARGEYFTQKKLRRAISLRWAQMKSHMEAQQVSQAALSTGLVDSLPHNASDSPPTTDDIDGEGGDVMLVDGPGASLCPQSVHASPSSPRPLDSNTTPNTAKIDYDPLGYEQDDRWILEFEALMATLPAHWMEETNWGELLDLPLSNAMDTKAPLHDSTSQADTLDEWPDWYDPQHGTEIEIGDSDKSEMLGVTQEFLDIIMGSD